MWWILAIWLENVSDYMQGMSLYRQNNWKGYLGELSDMAVSTKNEFWEIFEELAQMKFWAAFLELWDVWHCVVCLTSMVILGEWMMSKYPYVIIYHLCPFTSWKHGIRYADMGCIRSKNWHVDGKPKDHICCTSKKYK